MSEFDDLSQKIISDGTKSLEGIEGETVIDDLMEIVLNSREQCQMVDQLIKSQIEVKDEMINKLHKELEYYKQGAADKFIDQVMKAIIKVRKDMARQIDSGDFVARSAEEMQREYIYIFEDLSDLLEQQNIDVYSTPTGEDFNASIHLSKVEATDDPSLDKKVKSSISEGYKKGDKVLLPERVIVYQYRT